MKNDKLQEATAKVNSNDYNALQTLLEQHPANDNIALLKAKMDSIDNDDNATGDFVGLNVMVKLLDHHTNRPMEFMLVLPNESNIKERKVSILTPIGIALLGKRKGEQVMWAIGGGQREVTVLEVG